LALGPLFLKVVMDQADWINGSLSLEYTSIPFIKKRIQAVPGFGDGNRLIRHTGKTAELSLSNPGYRTAARAGLVGKRSG